MALKPKELSAAFASTTVVSEVGTVVAEPANAEFTVKLGQCFWMVNNGLPCSGTRSMSTWHTILKV